LEEEIVTRKPGELAFAPCDVPHTFANLSGAEARTLIVCTPAGFERYLDRIGAREAGIEAPLETHIRGPDGVHPSLAGQKAIARAFVGRLAP
jgi:lysophospholipase L1-like esterase